MPLVHIAMRAGKPETYRQAIFDGVYGAMREALNVPEDDQFMTITEHDAANFRYDDAYGVVRSADVVYIQVTVFSTRTADRTCSSTFSTRRKLIGRSATALR